MIYVRTPILMVLCLAGAMTLLGCAGAKAPSQPPESSAISGCTQRLLALKPDEMPIENCGADKPICDAATLSSKAEQGNAVAQYNLAVRYHMGSGMAPDDEAAMLWFRRAALQDLPQAQAQYGLLLSNGVGVQEGDLEVQKEAQKWLMKAAKADMGVAQMALGLMYSQGCGGVPQLSGTAAEWFGRAAQHGITLAALQK